MFDAYVMMYSVSAKVLKDLAAADSRIELSYYLHSPLQVAIANTCLKEGVVS